MRVPEICDQPERVGFSAHDDDVHLAFGKSTRKLGNNLGTSGAENELKPAIKITLRHDEPTR